MNKMRENKREKKMRMKERVQNKMRENKREKKMRKKEKTE